MPIIDQKYTVYYSTPPDTAFAELKAVAMSVWAALRRPDMVAEYNDFKNIASYHKSSFMEMLLLFDSRDMRTVISKLSEETKEEIRKRLKDGGYDEADYLHKIGL